MTQQQINANNQAAADAEVVRANAQVTLNSAGSTQSAALTADAIHQTQMADLTSIRNQERGLTIQVDLRKTLNKKIL